MGFGVAADAAAQPPAAAAAAVVSGQQGHSAVAAPQACSGCAALRQQLEQLQREHEKLKGDYSVALGLVGKTVVDNNILTKRVKG